MTLVRQPAEPERVVNKLDPITDVFPVEPPHFTGQAVTVYTERFPDGMYFGRHSQVRVVVDET
jgi:hypothetical protein